MSLGIPEAELENKVETEVAPVPSTVLSHTCWKEHPRDQFLEVHSARRSRKTLGPHRCPEQQVGFPPSPAPIQDISRTLDSKGQEQLRCGPPG